MCRCCNYKELLHPMASIERLFYHNPQCFTRTQIRHHLGESLTGLRATATAIEMDALFRCYLSINAEVCLFYRHPICSLCGFKSNPFTKPSKAKLQWQIVKDGSAKVRLKSITSEEKQSMRMKREGLENRWSSSRNTKSHPVRSEWLILPKCHFKIKVPELLRRGSNQRMLG